MGHIGEGEEGLECFETLHWAESQGFLVFVSSRLRPIPEFTDTTDTDTLDQRGYFGILSLQRRPTGISLYRLQYRRYPIPPNTAGIDPIPMPSTSIGLSLVSSAVAAIWNLFPNCSTDGARDPVSKVDSY